MGLLIDLQPVPMRIFEVVKARIQANRERLRRRLETPATAAPLRQGRVVAPYPNSMVTQIRPEPAATPRGGYPLALFYQSAAGYQWGGGSGPPTGSNVLWITTSDGSVSLSYETANITDLVPAGYPNWLNNTPYTAVTARGASGAGDGFNFLESETYTLYRTEDLFALPVDKDRCIVCLWQKYDLGYWKYRQQLSTTGGSNVYSNTYIYSPAAEYSVCFLVGKSGIRQLGPMPSVLLGVVTARNRNATPTAADNATPFPVPPTFLDDYAISAIGGDPQSGKYLGVSGGIGNDAGIYEVLGLPPAPPPRVYLVPFGPDEAGWIEFKSTKDDPPSYETSRFAPNRPGRIRSLESVIPTPPGVNVSGLAAWDWGKPGYCQEQLLALGFSPGNFSLTPPPP